MHRFIVSAIAFAVSCSQALSADIEYFETRIRPVLVERCYACHNSTEKKEGELALDHREGLRSGGSGGELIVPGEPGKSRLIAILRHEIEGLEMPEDSGKLDDAVIADFEKWIADGATDPRDHPPTAEEIEQATSWESILENRKRWWSFQPIEKPELPESNANPIDILIRKKLGEVGLSPAPPAEPDVLIRRLYFQLIGLPPTTEELENWLTRYAVAKTDHARVTEELVDHLLASEQFGARWARHWMDWIRYAESHGSEGDPILQNAWMYRDYLIRALNDDVPYDQLVREHLAGDLLDDPRINDELGLNESLLGTIQLRMVFHGFSPTDALDEKVRFVDDQVNAISKAFLGLTVSCARCHDHKFDAISQTDYYAMFGMFAACRPGRSIADAPELQKKNQQSLAELKLSIRETIASQWIDSVPMIVDRIKEKLAGEIPDHSLLSTIKNWNEWEVRSKNEPFDESKIVRAWNLGAASDFASWHHQGMNPGPTEAGEFAVSLLGDTAIHGVYPAGVYSHLLSTKHPLRLTSPDVLLDGKYDYWILAIGDDNSATRYVTQDYPRTGTVYHAKELTPTWTWQKLSLDYWQGDMAHFEIATGPDIPLQASTKPRSWFGATELRVVHHDSPVPDSRPDFVATITGDGKKIPKSATEAQSLAVDAIEQAVRAWRTGNCTDSQSLLIDECIRVGLLENKLDSLPFAKPLIEQYRTLESEIAVPRRVEGLDDVPERTQPLFIRGNHKQPADTVPRRFLEAIDDAPYPATETGRRQFAEDLLRDDNPLTRRVIVNRLWHHLFGRGIVATPDNFGKLGALPTHGELLDWMAIRFVEDGWSLKKMIRLIVTSESWQQSSEPSEESRQLDPDNLYLSHANVRRLEAEAIRDAMLTAAGNIDLDLQGSPVDGNSNRRSIFVRVHRNALDPMLRAFDFPEPHSAVGSRDVTNVPAQSLLMMNSPQVAEIASTLARTVLQEFGATSEADQISSLFRRVLSREPSPTETAHVRGYLQSTSDVAKQRQSKLAELTSRRDDAKKQISGIIEPKRKELSEANPVATTTASVTPFARWEFEEDASDSVGELHGSLIDGAEILAGALTVKDGAHVNTSSLTKSLTSKTLEAWVQLDTLSQRGGGVITVQTRDGIVFDSIVFGEQAELHWLAGSDNFARTSAFEGGEADSEAADRVVHVAICYHADGMVVGYRDGVRYGKPYKTSPPVEFKAGDAIVSFGVRHLPNGGNRQLAGRIERANLYDKALSDEEVSESFQSVSGRPSDKRVIESLSQSDQVKIQDLEQVVTELEQTIASYGTLPNESIEQQTWTDLARSLLTLKEFIYVR